jgi:hypothetical protein
MTYAASAGIAGRWDEAVLALLEAKRLQRTLSVEWVERFHPIVKASDRAIYIEGPRAAGSSSSDECRRGYSVLACRSIRSESPNSWAL